MEWKMPLYKLYTFWMTPWLICCFTGMLLHTEGKWLLKKNLIAILPLKSKSSWKFQSFNAIDGSIKKLKSCWISKNFNYCKMKNFKTFFSSYKQRSACSAPIRASYVSATNIFEARFTGKYRNLLSRCSRNTVLGRLKMVQCKCFFLRPTRKMFLVCYGSIFFIMLGWSKSVKWMRLFEQNFILKQVIVLVSFYWLWDFLLENLKLVDKFQIWGF